MESEMREISEIREIVCNSIISFVEDMKQVSLNNKFLVSYDVVSLFTNIPLNETIDLAVNLIKAKDSSINP